MYKLILFDFDGTIADTIAVGWSIYKKNAKKHRLPEFQSLEDIRNVGLKELFLKHKVNLVKLPVLIAMFQKEIQKSMHKVKAYPGMRTALKQIRTKARVAILSSNSRENINLFLKNNDIELLFDFVIGYPKLFGKASVISRILKKEGLKKKELLYVGDEVRDVEAMKKAGIDVAAVSWGLNSRVSLQKTNPSYIVDKPSELVQLI